MTFFLDTRFPHHIDLPHPQICPETLVSWNLYCTKHSKFTEPYQHLWGPNVNTAFFVVQRHHWKKYQRQKRNHWKHDAARTCHPSKTTFFAFEQDSRSGADVFCSKMPAQKRTRGQINQQASQQSKRQNELRQNWTFTRTNFAQKKCPKNARDGHVVWTRENKT